MDDRFILREDEVVIDPNASEKELDKQKQEFDSLPHHWKMKSNTKAIGQHGMTNQDIYDKAKSKYLTKPVDDTETIKTKDDVVTYEYEEGFKDEPKKIYPIKSYTDADVEAVKTWSLGSNINIVSVAKDIEELENMWVKYNSMIRKHKRVSDWKCLEVFGVTNQDFYEYQKSFFLSIQKRLDDYKEVSKDDIVTNTILSKNHDTTLDKVLDLEKTVSESGIVLEDTSLIGLRQIIGEKKDDYVVPYNILDSDIFPLDMPFYTPSELESLGVLSGEHNKFYPQSNDDIKVGKKSIKNWMDSYNNLCMGVKEESYHSSDWVDAVRYAIYARDRIQESTSTEDEINKANQTILELGWNPYIEFTPENRIAARERVLTQLQKSYNNSFIDISECYGNHMMDCYSILMESARKKNMHPVYIILIEGSTLFSSVIKATTKGPFSHAAISLDGDFSKIYSFTLNDSVNKSGGGLSIENIENYPQDNKLGVFAIFVKDEDYKIMKNTLKFYIDHSKETLYSFFKCVLLALNIPSKSDMRMFCSQFVDNLLKLCNIDITNKSSSLVNPNDFYKISESNNKIYKIYEGPTKGFDFKAANKLSKQLSKNAELIKEAVDNICSHEVPYEMKHVLDPVLEVKDLPVKFDDNGDVYIKPLKKLNCEKEYQEAHKLLLNYEQTNNYEGMKSELARLWYLNNYLEQKINAGDKDKSEYIKIRARVLNDFNKYLKIVCKAEPDFDFNKYFEESPYSDSYVRITNSTIKGAFKVIGKIIKK